MIACSIANPGISLNNFLLPKVRADHLDRDLITSTLVALAISAKLPPFVSKVALAAILQTRDRKP